MTTLTVVVFISRQRTTKLDPIRNPLLFKQSFLFVSVSVCLKVIIFITITIIIIIIIIIIISTHACGWVCVPGERIPSALRLHDTGDLPDAVVGREREPGIAPELALAGEDERRVAVDGVSARLVGRLVARLLCRADVARYNTRMYIGIYTVQPADLVYWFTQ